MNRTVLSLCGSVAVFAACGGARPVTQTPEPAETAISHRTPEYRAPEAEPEEHLVLLAEPSTGCGLPRDPGDAVETIDVGDEVRSYRVHTPLNYVPLGEAPLVVNYHGSSKTAVDQESYSGLIPIADREGFVLVTPEGSGYPQGWDIAGIYNEDGSDDVAFTAALVERLESELCIDSHRVYATGLSNGAEMASQVACFLPGLFAAAAPVAGIVYQECDGEPVAMVTFHGTEDYNVPFDTAPDGVAQWAAHNGCLGDPFTEQLTEHVDRLTSTDCSGADVVFYVIDGGGHTWPGAKDDAGGAGPTTHEISASELIWQFFAAHPKPRP